MRIFIVVNHLCSRINLLEYSNDTQCCVDSATAELLFVM